MSTVRLHGQNIGSTSAEGGSQVFAGIALGPVTQISGETGPSWKDVSSWIFASEPIFSQRTFQTSLQRRRTESSTGRWFLDGEAFRRWQSEPGSFLWLHGKTGCGKTMLCSSAIRQLHSVDSGSSQHALIYHFFTVADQRSRKCDTLARALVYQLAEHNDDTRARAKELYKKAGEGSRLADSDQLLSLLEDLSKVLNGVYVIVDSLDECIDQDETCAFLEELCKRQVPGIRILASSNTTQSRKTEATLKKLKTDMIYVTTDAVNRDIEAHIRKGEGLDQWENDQSDKIISHITAGSNGSFRWAIGQVMEIQKCDTEVELDTALASLPKSLAETYERILSGITAVPSIQHLRTLLCWLLYAARPLRIEELRQTVAIDWLEEPYFDAKKRLNKRPGFLDQCTFLIAIDEDSVGSDMFALDDDDGATAHAPDAGSTWHKDAVLRLAHSSVFQFFQETEKLSPHASKFCMTQPAGHLMLAQSSLAYILYLDSTAAPTPPTDQYPLFDYVIQYWYGHVQKAGPGNTVLATLLQKVLNTGWDMYRLVTYLNTSTEYNPWSKPQASTSDHAANADQGNDLCETCQKIQYCELQGPSGFSHGAYDSLVASAHNCRLCKMIHHALLQFGVARRCKQFGYRTLSEVDSERLELAVDDEIRLNAGCAEVRLRAETRDPFLLISCHCYFGRLHLFTNTESPLASKITGRAIPSRFGEASLQTCARWLQVCKETHSRCLEDSRPRFLPTRVIDVGEEPMRLLVAQSAQEGRYGTLSYVWGDLGAVTIATNTANLDDRMHEIRFDYLPATIRDAITITRHLGIRYLWIDSVCVIHDSITEADHEVPRMPEYYANATLNIVAGVKNESTGIFLPRLPPRFSSVCINESEDVFVGWLGTDSYCDPRGVDVKRYPDGWRYQSPTLTRGWITQEIGLARRNLMVQADEGRWVTSQLYMQCQEEIRWENGRVRQGTREDWTDWCKLVEECSGQPLGHEMYRLPLISALARNHSSRTSGQCGDYLAGLWAGDLFRGLLWRTQDARAFPPCTYGVPSWSWAKGVGKVKHVWPLNAIVCAEARESGVSLLGPDPFGAVFHAFIKLQGSLVGVEAANWPWDAWAGETTVNIRAEDGYATGVRIYYCLDWFGGDIEPGIDDLYALKITRRVALLLTMVDKSNLCAERVGLMIVAKPDTQKWASVLGQCVVTIE